jgi:transcriptional regulator of nitric oxide reductase
MGQFSVELTALGFELHQLSAFDKDGLKAGLTLPDAFEPIAMMGIGKGKVTENTPEDLAEMEAGRVNRERKPLEAIVKTAKEPFES